MIFDPLLKRRSKRLLQNKERTHRCGEGVILKISLANNKHEGSDPDHLVNAVNNLSLLSCRKNGR